jgi:uncharacterized protein (DUF362 family)
MQLDGIEKRGNLMSKRSNRRQFLKQAAVVGAVAACPGVVGNSVHAAENTEKSRLVIVKNPDVLGGDNGSEIKADILAGMLDQAVARMTGRSNAEEAWKSLFKPEDVVGIKINGLGGRGATTNPEVAYAAANAVVRAGVKPSNVIIWENRQDFLLGAGFKLNGDGDGIRVVAVGNDWEAEPTQSGSINGRLAKVLARDITALINVPFMKDHMMAGTTGALKNHYGSFNNPFTCHNNHCNPYIADLNLIPAIRNKTRLIIMDALRPLADGGPMFRPNAMWKHYSLLVSRDPVAVDAMAWKIIDERRKETGMPTVAEAGREPAYIAKAASYGLGVDDFEKMDIIRIG